MEEVAQSVETEADVVRRYDWIVRHLASKFRVHVDIDDLIQIGRVELLIAARAWPSKAHTAAFWTYARKAVVRTMIDHVSREIARAAVEADAEVFPQPSTPPDTLLEAKELLTTLTERETDVVAGHVADLSQEEIGERTGVCQQRVQQILSGALKSLRKRA